MIFKMHLAEYKDIRRSPHGEYDAIVFKAFPHLEQGLEMAIFSYTSVNLKKSLLPRRVMRRRMEPLGRTRPRAHGPTTSTIEVFCCKECIVKRDEEGGPSAAQQLRAGLHLGSKTKETPNPSNPIGPAKKYRTHAVYIGSRPKSKVTM